MGCWCRWIDRELYLYFNSILKHWTASGNGICMGARRRWTSYDGSSFTFDLEVCNFRCSEHTTFLI